MTARPFVVTGCAGRARPTSPRCSKSSVSGAATKRCSPARAKFPGFGGWEGDSSWLAVPFLGQLPPGTVVIHVVREPSAVIRSLVATRFFTESTSRLHNDLFMAMEVLRASGVRGFVRRLDPRRGRRLRRDFVAFRRALHCAGAFEEPTDSARAARYWIEWNDRVAGVAGGALPYERVRIEELDASRAKQLLERMDRAVEPDAVDRALAAVSATANRRSDARALDQLSAKVNSDLADAAIVQKLREAAVRFGYEPSAATFG